MACNKNAQRSTAHRAPRTFPAEPSRKCPFRSRPPPCAGGAAGVGGCASARTTRLTRPTPGNRLPHGNRMPFRSADAAGTPPVTSEEPMPRQHNRGGLGARERQIMDAIYSVGEASVADVLARLADPPTYSAVRTMIRLLEKKGLLRHRQVGTKYVYRPTRSRELRNGRRSSICCKRSSRARPPTPLPRSCIHRSPSSPTLTSSGWINSSKRRDRRGTDMTIWLIAALRSHNLAGMLADATAKTTLLLLLAWLIAPACAASRRPCGIDCGRWRFARRSQCRRRRG